MPVIPFDPPLFLSPNQKKGPAVKKSIILFLILPTLLLISCTSGEDFSEKSFAPFDWSIFEGEEESKADYVVAQDGSGDFVSFDGLSSVLKPGSRIAVKNGFYKGPFAITIPGTRENPIIFQAYPGHRPVLFNSLAFSGPVLETGNVYSVILEEPEKVTHLYINRIYYQKKKSLKDLTKESFYQKGETLFIFSEQPMSEGSHEIGIIADDYSAVVAISGDYIMLKGFEIRYSSGFGIFAEGNYIRIDSCKVAYSHKNGILIYGKKSGKGWNNEVTRCEVYENVLENFPRGTRFANGGWAMGLCYGSGGNGRIIGNRVYNNHGEGIGSYGIPGTRGTQGLVIKNNEVFNNWSVNVWFDHTTRGVVEGNFIYNTSRVYSPDLYRSRPAGFLGAEEESGGHKFGKRGDLKQGIIKNNIIVNCRTGIGFWKSAPGSGLKDFAVFNNTIVNEKGLPISIEKGDHRGFKFYNNIVYSADKVLLNLSKPEQMMFDHNLWFTSFENKEWSFLIDGKNYTFKKWQTTFDFDKNSSFADPLFKNINSLSASGYALENSSPCINRGITIIQNEEDYSGQPRKSGKSVDIGAIEH